MSETSGSRAVIVLGAMLIAAAVAARAADQSAGTSAGKPTAAVGSEPAVKSAATPAGDLPAVAAPKSGAQAGAAAADALVARVNGIGISQAEFDRNWEYFAQRGGLPATHVSGGQTDELRKQVLDRLVDEELLFQESQRNKHLAGDDAVETEIAKARSQFPTPEAFRAAIAENKMTEDGLRTLLRRNLSIQAFVEKEFAAAVTVTDAEVHEFFTGNKDKFETPEQARARHILVKVDAQADAEAKRAAKTKAAGLLADLKGGAGFEELAKKNSDCPSAAQGGDLGLFVRGQMVSAFDAAAFALKPGELSDVVETQFGFHIIKLEEKQGASLVPEQAVAPKIREFLGSRKTENAVERKLKTLREQAKIDLLVKF